MEATPHLTPIIRPTLPDEIMRRVVALILETGMRPGDRLPSERELMARLGVGRSSLREAIKTLSAFGIVSVLGGDGMRVGGGTTSALTKPLSWGLLIGEHPLREVIEARRMVEGELAALAATRATDDEIATLQTILAAMHAALDDADGYSGSDEELHLTIARAARNGVLFHVLETLQQVVRVWIYKTFSEAEDKLPGWEEHAAVVAAIAARDAAAAREAMTAHLDAAAGRLLALLPREDGEMRLTPRPPSP